LSMTKPTSLLFILLTIGAGHRAGFNFRQSPKSPHDSLMEVDGTVRGVQDCVEEDVTVDGKYTWLGEGKYTVKCDEQSEIGLFDTWKCTKEKVGQHQWSLIIEKVTHSCHSKETCPALPSKQVQFGAEIFQALNIQAAPLNAEITLSNKCPRGTEGTYMFRCVLTSHGGSFQLRAAWQLRDKCVKLKTWCKARAPRFSINGVMYTAKLPAVDPTVPGAPLKFKVVAEANPEQPLPCEDGKEGFYYYKCVSGEKGGVWKEVDTCDGTESSSEYE